MKKTRLLWRVARWTPAFGLLSIGGCMSALESNLDFVLSAEAIGNLLTIPANAFLQLAQFVISAGQ